MKPVNKENNPGKDEGAYKLLKITNTQQRGFTLIEMMIVIAIIAILAAIAVPGYSQYVLKSKRSVAKTILLNIASSEMTYKMDNKTYGDLSDLYGGEDEKYINSELERSDAAAADSLYSFTASSTDSYATTFTITATYAGNQVADTECASFSITHSGVRSSIDSDDAASDCW